MNDIPNFVWRADFHCRIVSQYIPDFIIVNEDTYRYGNLPELELSLQDTKYMTITNLYFTKYIKTK